MSGTDTTGTELVFGPQPEHLAGPPVPSPFDGADRRRLRRRVVIAAVTAVAVLVVAVLVPLLAVAVRGPERTLREVRAYAGLPRDHTPGPVSYGVVPPVGGPHDPAWLDCGAYDAPVRDENAVHDLEHGTVWITYDPALPDVDVAALTAALPDNGLLSPYDGLPSPVVVTVWGRQLRLTGADDPRLPLFLARFGDGHTSPEPLASCHGGITGGGSAGDSQPV